MTFRTQPAIRVRNPAELLDAVPYLLGFHPDESLVVIGFALTPAGERVDRMTVTARIDLPPAAGAGGPQQADFLLDADLVQPLLGALRGSATDAVLALLFTERIIGDPRTDPELTGLLDALEFRLLGSDIQLVDALAATRQRWWAMHCDDPECCPPPGRTRSVHPSAVAAEATYAGMVALPDRECLAATLHGLPDESRGVLLPALRRADERLSALTTGDDTRRARRNEVAALLSAVRECAAGATLGNRRLARFGAALRDAEFRDALWLAVDDRSVDGEQFLGQLHSRLPPPYDAAPLFLYGWSRWRDGHGPLAAMAAERILASDPGYSAAHLLIEAVHTGMNPRTTPPLSASAPDRARRPA